MNTRTKGLRLERRAKKMLEAHGYTVFRLHQPAFTAQGPVDLIALGHDRIRLVQVRANQWRAQPVKAFAASLGLDPLTMRQQTWSPSVEIWRFEDGTTEPKQRVIA